MLAVLLGAVSLRALVFNAEPHAAEVARGEALLRRKAPLEALAAEDRIAIGSWSDGLLPRDVEHVLWISPSFASRTIGYLNARERWDGRTVQERWRRLRRDFGGTLSFVVTLASYPREDPLEFGLRSFARREDLEDVRFVVTYPLGTPPTDEDHISKGVAYGRLDPDVRAFRTVSSDTWRDSQRPWWLQLDRSFDPLRELVNEPELTPYDRVLGRYHSRAFLISVPLPERLDPASEFHVHVVRNGKRQTATFRLKVGRLRGHESRDVQRRLRPGPPPADSRMAGGT